MAKAALISQRTRRLPVPADRARARQVSPRTAATSASAYPAAGTTRACGRSWTSGMARFTHGSARADRTKCAPDHRPPPNGCVARRRSSIRFAHGDSGPRPYGDTVWGWFLRVLTWPAWTFRTTASVRDLLAQDLRAVLLVVFVALILAFSAISVTAGSGVLAGLASLVFASALAAFGTAFVASHASWLGAFEAAGDGSRYGLFVGWLVGLAVIGTRRRRVVE